MLGLGLAPEGAALEVGCEGGRWSMLLADAGRPVVCVDVDADALAVCASRIPQATCIRAEPGDRTLPGENGSVALVLVYEVRDVIEADWFPGEAARVLGPGCVLVCSSWNPASLRGLAYRSLAALTGGLERDGVKRFQNYYRGPSYHAFRRALRRAGLEVAYEEGICWAPFSRGSDSALVPLATAAERRLGLRRLPQLSPWVLTVARKGT